LKKDKVLVVGLGETGLPLYELLKECGKFTVYGFDINSAKMREIGQAPSELPSKVDVIHVCIPCIGQQKFVDIVAENAERFKPKLVIIHSTVPPGTTMKVYESCGKCLVAHSPIRGVHKSQEYMKWELERWTKYVGGVTPEAGDEADRHLRKLGLRTKVLKGSIQTELAKMFETTYRAWMIVCFQEMHRISRHYGADFDEVVDFIEDTHRVRFDRPVMYPGVIGGHCLVPNIELLLKYHDSKLLRLILESNERRKEELKHKNIAEEADRIRKRVEKINEELKTEGRGVFP